jgi:hypothetical protein
LEILNDGLLGTIDSTNEGLLGASDSPKARVLEGNPRGVAVRPNDYERYGRRSRMVIATPLAEKIRGIARSQLGKPFDNGAIKAFWSDALPGERDWRETDAWFCSELVAWSFEWAGCWSSPPSVWPKNRLTPSDLFMIFLFDPRWINRDTFWDELA